MLDEKQLQLARTEPKTFLQQYCLLKTRIDAKLSRLDYWQKYCELSTVPEHAKSILDEAKALSQLAIDIENAIASADITEQYKIVLEYRYIKGLTINELSKELKYNKRWSNSLQEKALAAFAKAV